MGAYDKYIQQEKIKGWVHNIASLILTTLNQDEDLTEDDTIEILKQATDRVVSIIAKKDGKSVS